MKQTSRIAFAIAAVAAASTIWAVEVTPEQAKTAVRNWIELSPKRMDSEFRSKNTEAPVTARDGEDRALYHAVNLEGGGFVVTSGDTRLSPIVAFSDRGRFDGDEAGPLHALLAGRFEGAVSALAKKDRATGAAGGNVSYAEAEAESEWGELLADGGTPSRATGAAARDSVSDVRVNKLLQTQWGQTGFFESISYDDGITWNETYYPSSDWYIRKDSDLKNKTYENGDIPCGCVATAGAQLMYFWKAPSSAIATFSNTCYINGDSYTKSSKSGAFAFDSMFKTWDDKPFPTDTQREAVGKLVWNVCVAVGMSWTTPSAKGYSGAGSASSSVLVSQLKSRFGYKSGEFVFYNIDTDTPPSDIAARVAEFNNALFASLDAKMPVVMSIGGYKTSKSGVKQSGSLGHSIIADGYGYVSTKRYTHLNFGWNGGDDAWYYLPDEAIVLENWDESHSNYVQFNGLGFNIHPTISGDVISGRVLNSSSSPVASATVTLYDSGNTVLKTSSTDAKGLYSFRVTGSGDYKVKAVSGAYASPMKSVSISAISTGGTYGYGGMTGNKWGNDLKLSSSAETTYTITYNPGKYGTGTQQTATKTKDVALTLKGALFTTTGATQNGWATENLGAKVYNLGGQYTANASATLYPSWASNTYKVRFNANGGTGSMSDLAMTYGVTKALTKNAFSNGSYKFAGWATTASGSVVYADGAGVKNLSSANGAVVTLYAKWTSGTTTYTVTYDHGKYGTGAQQTATKTYGVALTLKGALFTTTGATQNGWATENLGAKVYELGGKYTANANVTLYPSWASNTYKVRFNANGGTGSMADMAMTYGTSKNLTKNTFKNGTKTFAGWALSASGSVVYYDGEYVKNVTGTQGAVVTLYARWATSSTKYSVFYNRGKYGSGSQTTVPKSYGVALTLKGALFTTAGAYQTGWATENLGAKVYELGATYTANASVTLYPAWTPSPWYLRFNSNGGTGKMPDEQMVYGTTKAIDRCTFMKDGYAFAGWATEANGSVVYADCAKIKNLTTALNGVVTLYAKWKAASSFTITYEPGKYGSGTKQTATKQKGVALTLADALFTTTGATQNGWATENLGAKKYDLKGQYTANSSITLYPSWQPNTYQVKFDKNGGSGAMPSQSMVYGRTATLLKCAFTRERYRFLYWFIPGGNGENMKVFKDEATVKNLTVRQGATVYLYAAWEKLVPNDDFADAFSISGKSGDAYASTVDATMEEGEPLPKYNPYVANTIWWVWKAPSSGTFTFTTSDTGFDTVMGVYKGTSLSTLTAVSEDDDSGPNRTSVCTFTATKDTKYYIVVSGWGSNKGMVYLDWKSGTYTGSAATGAMATGAKAASAAADGNGAAVPEWAVGTFYGGGEDAPTTITVSSAGKVSGKVQFAGGRWTIVGKAAGLRIEAVVADADGDSVEVVFAIIKKEDGGCRIESEDGSIWAE